MSRAQRVTAVASGMVVAVILGGAAIGTAASSFASQHSDVSPIASLEAGPDASVSPAAPEPTASATPITNVVLIMADDLDWQTFMQVPRLAALRQQGTTFTQHVVTDSLCCPSRTSVLRSQFVHNHQVISNIQATGGGWPTFQARGEQLDCLPTWLSAAGVKTAMIGKFLNEYPGPSDPKTYVPPGWSTWVVPTNHGYEGYNYTRRARGIIYSRVHVAVLSRTDSIRSPPAGAGSPTPRRGRSHCYGTAHSQLWRHRRRRTLVACWSASPHPQANQDDGPRLAPTGSVKRGGGRLR